MNAGHVGCDAAGGAADLLVRCAASLEEVRGANRAGDERRLRTQEEALRLGNSRRAPGWLRRDARVRLLAATQFHIYHSHTFINMPSVVLLTHIHILILFIRTLIVYSHINSVQSLFIKTTYVNGNSIEEEK